MADNLDDEWWEKQNNQVPDSGSESNDEDVEIEKADSKQNKRKITTTETDKDEDPPKKKKKKKRKRITEELKEGSSKRGSAEQLVQVIEKHFDGKLSAVEQDEMKLDTGHDFYGSSEEDHTPTSYFRSILPKWNKLLKTELKPGSPLVLVLCSSAIRAVELNRELKDFKTESCKCAKLFAKHFKLEEQQKFLEKRVCHLGIGTPNRILALLKLKALHPDVIKAVVLDFNWRDVKSKRIIDIPDVKGDLLNLMKDYLIPHINNSKCKIGIL
ncbi:protein CMSS1-like [Mytilus californianus]|uniref:protein CMSS1-like n=1 Tax=Mytilus californianus TaxID=6549 RepID=UPI002245A2D6|nr:protein CMSS1-like [Mytilus californianus]